MIPTWSSSFCFSRVFLIHVYSAPSGYSWQRRIFFFIIITRLIVWLLLGHLTSIHFVVWKWLFQLHFCEVWAWKSPSNKTLTSSRDKLIDIVFMKQRPPSKLNPACCTEYKSITNRLNSELSHAHECLEMNVRLLLMDALARFQNEFYHGDSSPYHSRFKEGYWLSWLSWFVILWAMVKSKTGYLSNSLYLLVRVIFPNTSLLFRSDGHL